jgi:hypothetical protein
MLLQAQQAAGLLVVCGGCAWLLHAGPTGQQHWFVLLLVVSSTRSL